MPLRIGVASCFFHADPQRPIFKGKTLLYLVENVGHWLLGEKVLVYLIPTLPEGSPVGYENYIHDLDGLVLQGGADVAPQSYKESPLKPEWSGDAVRDRHETELLMGFIAQDKPVLGLCRGLQLINVALGGTLFQDIATQIPGSLNHRNWEIYDQNIHDIEILPGTGLERVYPGIKRAKVNSVHHQAINALAPALKVEAKSAGDGIIEAARLDGEEYVVGVQWHPEFQHPNDRNLLSTAPLLREFLQAAQKRKANA
jgi:putative glutamine amidotransferase